MIPLPFLLLAAAGGALFVASRADKGPPPRVRTAPRPMLPGPVAAPPVALPTGPGIGVRKALKQAGQLPPPGPERRKMIDTVRKQRREARRAEEERAPRARGREPGRRGDNVPVGRRGGKRGKRGGLKLPRMPWQRRDP